MLENRLSEARRIDTMRKSFKLVRKRQRVNAGFMPDLLERKKRLREVRERSVGNQILLGEAVDNLKRNNIRVFLAKDAAEAIGLILAEIGDEKLIVKSKSNLTKEIDLVGQLRTFGIEVIETDIGDRIIQIANEKPSHPTGPASHLSKREIARILSVHFGHKIPPVAEEIVKELRQEIRDYICRAKIGITGANAICAEEGAVLLQHNEGNIIEVAMRPSKHIILAGIDKIYPNLDESLNMLRIQTFCATGTLMTSFINIIAGPAQTADIEKKLVRGVHGPEQICLILVDNGRSDLAKRKEYKELLYCIGCGQCLLVCPAYQVYGNRFSVEAELGGRGVAYSRFYRGAVKDGALGLCLTCGKCYQNCPLSINIPAIISRLRVSGLDMKPSSYRAVSDFVHAHAKWILGALYTESLLLVLKLLELIGIEEK